MVTSLHTSYRLVVETLSPLHIASGRGDLVHDYDFVVEGKQALVIDLDRLLAEMDEARLRAAARDPRLSRLIPSGAAARYAAYALAAPPGDAPARIREHIKDPFLKFYVPGSSLKGALRTALAWARYKGRLDLVGQDPKSADDPLEQETFDYHLKETHRDLLRALRVADAYPRGGISPQALPVTVFSLRGYPPSLLSRGTSIYVEAVPEGARFEGPLTLDEYALAHRPERPEVALHQRRGLLDNLVEHCRGFAAALVDGELAFYDKYGKGEVQAFYQGMKKRQASLRPGEFLLCLGWGPGWRAKTVGVRLTPQDIERIADRYNFRRWRSPLFPGVFPKTRRLVGLQQPQKPLGWVKITLQAHP